MMDGDANKKEMLVAQLDMIRQQARIKWLENCEPQQEDANNNIMIPSLHPAHSQQNTWETWYKELHRTTPSVKEDTQSRDEDTRWNQSDRNYSIYRDNAETTTPEESDDDDLSAMVDLPLAKPNRGDIMDDNKVTDDTTEMEMGLHTDMNKEDLVAKMELLTNDPNLYDRKHMTNK